MNHTRVAIENAIRFVWKRIVLGAYQQTAYESNISPLSRRLKRDPGGQSTQQV